MITSVHKQHIIDACRRAWERGLLSGCSGNVSLRVREECLVTCSGAAKGYLRAEDIIAVRMADGLCPMRIRRETDGAETPRRPSSELGMHLALYRARPDIAAIVHAHPGHLLALSLRVEEQDFLRLPLFEAETLRAGLAFVPALPPGTEELARAAAFAAARPTVRALWLRGHGLACLGGTLTRALALAEELEHLAGVQLSA
ncbi:MAG: class II aldolase/adducin family protein [Desulfovibrionaceae bacterium]|nr:class II aldolase/adducin family protein [Desulfovibrionaceae bacterium]